MSDLAIHVENLGKAYSLTRQQRGGAAYLSFRDALTHGIMALGRRAREPLFARSRHTKREPFWALRDTSFSIRQGETVGIIGRNGAGKSTLLKLLSRITEPTTGRITIGGRVASLLEVGSGFHPELTGRENIFLNGAIMGMGRYEIRRKFDEIVSFAEIERFLDTQVKHYSSGMYMRLAFAVAAHLEPEILLVDEVLAVGDAPFQKKCLGKMDDVARGGRTVFFVSHHMSAVTRLCQRCILFSGGQVVADGPAAEVTGQYLQAGTGTSTTRGFAAGQGPGDGVARLCSARVTSSWMAADAVDIREEVSVEMDFETLQEGASLISCFSFINDQGTTLFVAADFVPEGLAARPRAVGTYRARCTVPGNLFSEGLIRVVAEVSTREPVYQIHFIEHDCVAFHVVDRGEPGSVRGGWGRPIPGAMRPGVHFESEYLGPVHKGTAADGAIQEST